MGESERHAPLEGRAGASCTTGGADGTNWAGIFANCVSASNGTGATVGAGETGAAGAVQVASPMYSLPKSRGAAWIGPGGVMGLRTVETRGSSCATATG